MRGYGLHSTIGLCRGVESRKSGSCSAGGSRLCLRTHCVECSMSAVQPRFRVGYLTRLFRRGYGRHVDPLACGDNVLYGKHQRGLLSTSNATAKPFHKPCAPGVVRDGGSVGHMLVDCERGDSLFVRRCSFVHHGKGFPSPCVARGETSASRQGCSGLDPARDLPQPFAVAPQLSPNCASRASDPRASFRRKSLQSAPSILRILFVNNLYS
jgi:hypothetical protein